MVCYVLHLKVTSNFLQPLADLVTENEHVGILSLFSKGQSNNDTNESSGLSLYESFVPIKTVFLLLLARIGEVEEYLGNYFHTRCDFIY